MTFSYEKGKLIRAEKSTGEYFSFKWEEFEEGEFVTESKVHTGRSVSYSYRRGLLERVRINGKSRYFEYNPSDRITCVVDFNGAKTLYEYNELNLPEKVTDARGRETSYSYDKMWNISSICHEKGVREHYLYDDENRLKAVRKERDNKL